MRPRLPLLKPYCGFIRFTIGIGYDQHPPFYAHANKRSSPGSDSMSLTVMA